MHRNMIYRMRLLVVGLLFGLCVLLVPLSASAQTPSLTYAALGDSVAAGAGLPLMSPASNEDMLCGRSDQAYPHILAQAQNLTLMHIACGGATTGSLYNSQQVNTTTLMPQIDAAFAHGRPDIIILTVGANDLGWSAAVRACYMGGTCGSTAQNIALAGARTYLRLKLGWALWQIYQKSDFNPPRVIVTGYFTPFALDKTCGDTQGLTPAKMQWLNSQEAQLNQAIQSVASFTGLAQYVQPDFSGHELCTAEPWIQGLQSPAPFHPNQTGQKVMAQAVMGAL